MCIFLVQAQSHCWMVQEALKVIEYYSSIIICKYSDSWMLNNQIQNNFIIYINLIRTFPDTALYIFSFRIKFYFIIIFHKMWLLNILIQFLFHFKTYCLIQLKHAVHFQNQHQQFSFYRVHQSSWVLGYCVSPLQ
jgi:hypothetical protein